MQTHQTKRLILRPFTENDFEAVHSYASCSENVPYMIWGPNGEDETRAFIQMAIAKVNEASCLNREYAVVLKETGRLIGGCDLITDGDTGEIGWIVHRDYWKQGYGTEMGQALLEVGFDELNLRRIVARCDAENVGSYRVMEKIGMRREGLFLDVRPPNKLTERAFSDELAYAVLREDFEVRKEMTYYNGLPLRFDGFLDVPNLTDGVIYLVCTKKKPAVPEKNFVPAYHFAVCMGGEQIGNLSFRIGYSDNLYYGGQIGYDIDERHRGNGYAVRACKLILPVAKAHSMEKLLITNNQTNVASRRVCEKLGARFLRMARLPEWNDLFQEGQRFENIFEWDIRNI